MLAVHAREFPQTSTKTWEIKHFRTWLHDIAARLICAHPEEIDEEINHCLKVAGEFWKLDQVCLAELSRGPKSVEVTHSFAASTLDGKAFIDDGDDICWLAESIESGKSVSIDKSQAENGVEEAAARDFCKKKNLASCMVLPLSTRESVQGALVLASLQHKREWNSKEMEDLKYFSEVLAGGIDRWKRVISIKELRQFEDLLAEISAKYINMPTEDIDRVIKTDFEKLGLLLGADRFNLYLLSEDKKSFILEKHFAWWPHEDDGFILSIAEPDIKAPDFSDKYRYLFNKWLNGEPFQFTSLDELPEEAHEIKQLLNKFGAKSYLSIPILVTGSTAGVLVVVTTHLHRVWKEELIHRLRIFGEVFVNAMVRKQSDGKLRKAFAEIKELKDQIEADYVYLREEIKLEHNFGDIVGKSNALKKILVKVEQVAPTNANVLILGETGTGKGLMARAIHNASRRSNRPFMQVNCAALTPTLIESELFGYEKGAFTGAQVKRIGRFELANGTTLFLDEIGELPLELQAKLLRVLQDGEVERVGGSTTIKTDVRVVAATNKDLEKEVEAGRFRRDLWYRLNVFPIYAPPLRERFEDIPLFVSFFVDKYSKLMGKTFNTIPQKAIKALQAYYWPGNVRELENTIERAVITSPEGNLRIEIPASRRQEEPGRKGMTIADLEREHIISVLNETLWRINGPRGAAQRLGINPSTLRFRMIKLGIKRPATQAE